MSINDFKKTKLWHKEFKALGYDSKLIFKKAKTKFEILSSLSFFLTIMASEILLNQPIQKKINIIHNNFFYKFISKDNKKIDRVEINSFSFSLFMILQKLFKEEDTLEKYAEEILNLSICHWSKIQKINEKQYLQKKSNIFKLWNENKLVVFSKIDSSKIDLIISLYKSFEVGIGNKEIIKKNIAVLGFSISKVFKEFRYDVINEFKKKEKIFMQT
mgnify:CR=1 FL=1